MGGPTSDPRRRALGPFAAPVGISITAGLVFVVLLVQVQIGGPLLWVDHAVNAVVAAHRGPVGIEAAREVSLATAFPSEVIAGLLLALMFTLRCHPSPTVGDNPSPTLRGSASTTLRARAPISLLLAVAGMLALLVVPATKELVGRARPDASVQPVVEDLATGLANDAAFPSGHASTSGVFVGLVYLLFAPHLARLGRRLLGMAAIGYAAAVGVSRVYLGVHWFTDVVAGWALGTVVVAGLAILARLQPESPTQKGNEPSR